MWGECGRRHFFLSEAEWQRFQVLKEERERMRERERDADDPHCEEEKAPKLRSDVLFVDWLVKTFGGAEGLKRAGGVVDVAGGRGDVAFRLVHRWDAQQAISHSLDPPWAAHFPPLRIPAPFGQFFSYPCPAGTGSRAHWSTLGRSG